MLCSVVLFALGQPSLLSCRQGRAPGDTGESAGEGRAPVDEGGERR